MNEMENQNTEVNVSENHTNEFSDNLPEKTEEVVAVSTSVNNEGVTESEEIFAPENPSVEMENTESQEVSGEEIPPIPEAFEIADSIPEEVKIVKEKRKIPPEVKEKIAKKKRKDKIIQIVKNTLAALTCVALLVGCILLIVNITAKNDDKSKENELRQKLDALMSLPYYKEENAARYEAYEKLNPETKPEDIVWLVNANQDQPKYGFDILVSGYDDLLVMINPYYKVADDYMPDDLVEVDKQRLRSEAAEAFKNMQKAASKNSIKIKAVSGYRTVAEQSEIYNNYVASESAEQVDLYCERAGYSDHHTGLAVDIFTEEEASDKVASPEYSWVKDNCYEYGFIIRYPKDAENLTGHKFAPGHLRYVGVEVSKDMKEKGITSFEEYHAKFVQ